MKAAHSDSRPTSCVNAASPLMQTKLYDKIEIRWNRDNYIMR